VHKERARAEERKKEQENKYVDELGTAPKRKCIYPKGPMGENKKCLTGVNSHKFEETILVIVSVKESM